MQMSFPAITNRPTAIRKANNNTWGTHLVEDLGSQPESRSSV